MDHLGEGKMLNKFDIRLSTLYVYVFKHCFMLRTHTHTHTYQSVQGYRYGESFNAPVCPNYSTLSLLYSIRGIVCNTEITLTATVT